MTQPSQATLAAEPIDQEELHRLYRLHQHALYSFFANRGFSREECRDLLQQTFLEAWRCRDSYSGSGLVGDELASDRAGAWLFGIAKNIWRMQLRDASRQKRDAVEVPLENHLPQDESGRQAALQLADPGPQSCQLEKCLADEERRLLREALLSLPERMRFCVVLSLRGYKYREIAERLQVSLNTVRKQLFDGREKLRQRLGAYFSDAPGET